MNEWIRKGGGGVGGGGGRRDALVDGWADG